MEANPLQGSTRGVNRGYEALLLDGPLAGVRFCVTGLPGGDPIETLPVRGERRGAYVLAGFANLRGIVPYRWVTKEEWAGLRRWLRLGGRTT